MVLCLQSVWDFAFFPLYVPPADVAFLDDELHLLPRPLARFKDVLERLTAELVCVEGGENGVFATGTDFA